MQNQGNIVVSPRASTPEFDYFQTLIITAMLAMPEGSRKPALPRHVLALIRYFCFTIPKHEEIRTLRPVLTCMNANLIDPRNINSRVAILRTELPVCRPDEPLSTAMIQQFHDKVFACKKHWQRIFKPEHLTQLLTTATHKGSVEVLSALFDKGASPNVKNVNGQTLLILACFYSHHKVVKLLLKRGADIKCHDHHQRTALLWTCMHGADDVAILEALINKSVAEKVDIVNKADHDGVTPLMVAAGSGSIERVKCLLAQGANLYVKDNEGRTALDHAQENSQLEVVKHLKALGARSGAHKLEPGM